MILCISPLILCVWDCAFMCAGAVEVGPCELPLVGATAHLHHPAPRHLEVHPVRPLMPQIRRSVYLRVHWCIHLVFINHLLLSV